MVSRIWFAILVVITSIFSILLHELGHCVFYWIQGIPATMSLVKEYPLIDITTKQYAIGSTGGPLVNILLIMVSYLLVHKLSRGTKLWYLLSALIISNSFYLFLRIIIGIVKNDGGEIEYMMNLIGLNFYHASFIFSGIALLILILWLRRFKVKISFINFGYYIFLFITFITIAVVLETIDSKYFWYRYPSIKIGETKIYNPK